MLLISTETLLEFWLATARSGRMSPLKSPTTTEKGASPAPNHCAPPKVPSPLPKSTTTTSVSAAKTRSCHPSPLKSPTATEEGVLPALKFRAAWKVPSPLPENTEQLLEYVLATAKS